MRHIYLATFLVVVLTVSVLGFRGTPSVRPPLELFPDMDHQAHLKPQAESRFFSDGRADRPVPAGTVARGELRDDSHLHLGKNADGTWARGFPAAVPVTAALLARGQDRYQIYCAPCHGAMGDGNGITKQYGMTTTPTYFDEKRVRLAVGELFDVITHGSAKQPDGRQNMQPYADKLTAEDRWAVVAYVRALQRAQAGAVADVPVDQRKELGL
jgi:mono/diheme cytochrome c family protein